jgi:hypothetical protein
MSVDRTASAAARALTAAPRSVIADAASAAGTFVPPFKRERA